MNGPEYSFRKLSVPRTIIVFAILLLVPGVILTGGCFIGNDSIQSSGTDGILTVAPASIYISRIFPEGTGGDDHYPGEEIKISFYLKNTGGSSAENIKVGLAADDFFEITDNAVYWEVESLKAGETVSFESTLKITSDIEEDSRAVIKITASSDIIGTTSRSSDLEILGVKGYSHNFIPIIGLHEIEDEVGIPIELSTTNFDNLCRTLKEFGYQTITFSELLKHIDKGRALPEKAVIITSDDGYQDNYTNAFPILKKYGYTMTVFLVTGAISETEDQRMDNKVFNERSDVTRPMLIWPEVEEMHKYGCEFLSHSVNHIRLGLATDQEVLDELIMSRVDIEGHLGGAVSFFAWPFDNYSEDKWPLIEEAGYRGAVRYWGGIEDLRSIDLYNIKRVEFNSYVSPVEYVGYLELFDISIESNIEDFEIPVRNDFEIEYIIKNNEDYSVNISSLEFEIPENMELIEVIKEGDIKEFPALSEGIFMWVGDSYLVEAESEISIRLRLRAIEEGKVQVKFRITAYNNYINSDDLELIILSE